MRSCDVQWPPTLRDTLPSAQQQSAANTAHEWNQNLLQKEINIMDYHNIYMYSFSPLLNNIIGRIKITRPGDDKFKPKVWFKYSLLIDY